jgi:tRNA pseudouridine55 synthase
MTRTPRPTVAEPRGETAVDGLLVIDKPTGCTSHDVVARVRRLAATRKVGHAGTLDPMATGVLLVGIGRATRLLGHLAVTDKAYTATIRLGQSTVTDDAEGEIVSTADARHLDEIAIRSAMSSLTGDLKQVPAAVSAVKVDGQRAYARVRAGEDVALTARPVHVSRFDLLDVRRTDSLVDVDVLVECSTGTYVRALARDLGAALCVGGHLSALRRIRVGPYTEAHASTLDALTGLGALELPVLPLGQVVARSFPTYEVRPELEAAVRNGRRLPVVLADPGPVAIVSTTGDFLALYRADGSQARAVAVFAPT